jgi:hypothetical protein
VALWSPLMDALLLTKVATTQRYFDTKGSNTTIRLMLIGVATVGNTGIFRLWFVHSQGASYF